MTDTIPIPRELVERAASALEDSVDMVRNDYATNWRHGMPTRAAQLEGMRRNVEAHESALADLRSALTQQAEPARPLTGFDIGELRRASIAAAPPADVVVGGRLKLANNDLPATPSSPSAEPAMPCGHHPSLMLHSAETGEPLYCELCDDKSGRKDAELRETELAEANRVLREKLAAQPSGEVLTPLKDHDIAALVNDLRDIALQFHATQQLRERISQRVRATLAKIGGGK